MAERKAFLLRLDPALYDALQRWADAELRSVNGQVEYLLREALRQAGRLPLPDRTPGRRKGEV
ncbi:MAG: Arc family DNA binding domain-containing protein [Acidobacteria bacterium]|nr:Arc family DNA binding domain-containing protein [Acidobacteriota bacterium]